MKQFLKNSGVFLTMATIGYIMLVIVWAHFVPFGFLKKNNDFVDSLFTSQGAYYNFNRTLEMDDVTDFIYYHHLSPSGVVKTNIVLVGLLKGLEAPEK
jgi:hypothetical protein